MTTRDESYEPSGFGMPPAPEERSSRKNKDGVNYFFLFIVACILVAFVMLVLANLTGTALASVLGIGAYAIR